MPSLRYHGPEEGNGPEPDVIPFPETEDAPEAGAEEAVSEVMDALESASRRMEDLAKALGCLGYFDDDDRPRAA
jgi:hypothetical protein